MKKLLVHILLVRSIRIPGIPKTALLRSIYILPHSGVQNYGPHKTVFATSMCYVSTQTKSFIIQIEMYILSQPQIQRRINPI